MGVALLIIIVAAIVFIIPWIVNAIADSASDAIHNSNARRKNASSSQQQELLRDRYK